MNHRTKVFVVVFLFFLSIYAAVAFYDTTPKPSQPFIGFGVYSEQMTLSRYTTGLGSTVNVNQTNHWTLNITNEVGSTQFIQIISRLGSNQTGGPNSTSPAPLQVLTNSTLFVPNKNTSLQSFDWKITSVVSSGGSEYLTLNINGRSLNSTLGNPVGYPFRLFFELWTFNSSQGRFQYYTWLQVGFSVND